MKKLLSVLLAFVLIFTVSASVGEEKKPEKILPDSQSEEKEETNRSFTIPVGVGIIYSVILDQDSVSVVFSPIRNKAAALGLKSLDFLADVKEIKCSYMDGRSVVIPAGIEIKSYDVGTFICLNLSFKTVTAIPELFASESGLDKVAFVLSDGTEREMSISELNQALSSAFGTVVDIAAQAKKAIVVFLKNLSNKVWWFAEKTSSSVRQPLADAWRWISDSAASAGQSLSKLKGKVREAIGSALENSRSFLKDTAEKVEDFWNGLRGILFLVLWRLRLR